MIAQYLLRRPVPHGKIVATHTKVCIQIDFRKNALQCAELEREASLTHGWFNHNAPLETLRSGASERGHFCRGNGVT